MNMKKYLLGAFVTGVAACLWSAGAAANLVLNGSCEDLNGSSTLSDGYYEALNNGSSRLPNWDVTAIVNAGVDIVRETGIGYGDNDWAQHGVQGIDMAGSPGPGSISQDISTTASQAYRLSFWTLANGSVAKTGLLGVKWNGTTIPGSESLVALAQGNAWTEHVFTVLGTGGFDNLMFSDLQTGGSDAGVLLDNVSLTAVPLPPAAILFGSVLFGFSVVARKRNRSALAA